eukprot:TRINITY_DN10339_c0_g1_i1.p2 TRINITY_DN10339_c0_g1~~TRINITY_DN10339_c0_g1_i1.p2  ORF type:complete len:148 (+),score=7.58 TRINITY_DN10339_c0_g1_i1:67-510(+)
MMTFPGDLLHGVLPVRPDPESVGQPASQRLTLMIGWWGTDVASVAPREPLGPCGPLPAVSPDCTWPQALACCPLEVSAAEPRPLASYDGVEEVAPVWEEIPDGPPPGPPLSPLAPPRTSCSSPGPPGLRAVGVRRRRHLVSRRGRRT